MVPFRDMTLNEVLEFISLEVGNKFDSAQSFLFLYFLRYSFIFRGVQPFYP